MRRTLIALVIALVGIWAPVDYHPLTSASSATSLSEAHAQAHPLDMMETVFRGNFTRGQIKARLDRAMRLYDLPITRENYSRAGSVLVRFRKDEGVREMDLLQAMIEMHTPGLNLTFAEASAFAVVMLTSE